MTGRWQKLASIAEVKFQRHTATLHDLQIREEEVMQNRAQLQSAMASARNELRGLHPVLSNSGDVLWQAWIGKNQRDLGMQAARLRAEKEIALPAVRKSFGQKQVCEVLAKKVARQPSGCG